MGTREKVMKVAVQHIVNWSSGEAYFAIVQGEKILKALRDCRNWNEARAEYRAFLKG